MLTYEQVARIAHAANREYCIVNNLPVREEWWRLDEGRKAVVISGVEAWATGKVTSPQQSHDNWMRDMAAAGWTYGPVRDEVKKEHECMVPYDQLPEADRLKDTLFMSIVKVFFP